MEIAETLRIVTRRAQQDDELPDYLAERIFRIADLLPSAKYHTGDIEKLAEQITLYDTYEQTGYLGMGVNHVILENTIQQIEQKLTAHSS